MERPTRDEVLIRQAEIVAERSTCTRASVGVVIAHEYRVVSQGYNGAPAGLMHCDHTCRCIGAKSIPVCSPHCVSGGIGKAPHSITCDFSIWTARTMGVMPAHDENCGETTPCTVSVHAEANAIAFAAKYGVPTNNAVLYTTVAPCLPCAQLVINAGIARVVYVNEHRDNAGVMLLRAATVSVWSLASGRVKPI